RSSELHAPRGAEHEAQDDLPDQGAQSESRTGRREDGRGGSLARGKGPDPPGMTPRNRRVFGVLALTYVVGLAGCARGCTSSRPPIHPNPSMDDQPKVLPQTASDFFYNGSSMRPPVPGTVPIGGLREDTAFYTGKGADGQFVATIPVPVNEALV